MINKKIKSTNENAERSSELPLAADSGFFRALISYWIHEDRLIWSHTQLLMALQVAVLAAAYGLSETGYKRTALIVPGIGVLLTVAISFNMTRCWRNRKENEELTRKVGQRLSEPYSDTKTRSFCLPSDVRAGWPAPFYGRWLVGFVICLILAINIGMFFWLLLKERPGC